MKSFSGLFKKDLLISRFWSVTWMFCMLLAIFASFAFAHYTGEPMALFGAFVTILLFHSLFCPLMIISQLRLEGKTQLWLYNPNKGAVLLLSKLAAAAVYQLASQVILFMFGLIVRGFLRPVADSMFSVSDLFLVNIAAFLESVFFAIWVMFLWTIYEALRKYPAIKKIRWLIPLFIYNAYGLLEGLFIKSGLFESAQKFWSLSLKMNFKFHYYQDSGWTVSFSKIDLPGVLLLYYAVLGVCLFYFSGKILDRRVEV
ncbi:hypothetical protein P9D51_10520 [Bacillus sonorensis]|uniref:hypothetical protein n=1 Tax=Bacillus TaxID=1386 RepID=UPI00049640BE|nr:hypothetical protein [Bacillus sonorensis]MCF7619619.1 hypothetical protein [Bacillus sonorensis]MCY7855983.1 hypothetical protein [Bacillus sonorensis]MCY8025619.1 hypothetical protein [Bacillus sonorensis]MCY8032860.1 hypothetical protein [Bacillus sonorensis]MCY8087559.1 hypothetical protein [Bacillus sonorensis]